MNKQLEDAMNTQKLSEVQKQFIRIRADSWTEFLPGRFAMMLNDKGWGQFGKKQPKTKKVCQTHA